MFSSPPCPSMKALISGTNDTWMFQEVSTWLVNGLFHLLINGVFVGVKSPTYIRSPLIHISSNAFHPRQVIPDPFVRCFFGVKKHFNRIESQLQMDKVMGLSNNFPYEGM